jgi:hypothetical protein
MKSIEKLTSKRSWNSEEDDLLRQLVIEYGAKDWSSIA